MGTIRDIAPVPLPLRLGAPNHPDGQPVNAGGIVCIGAAMDNHLRGFDTVASRLIETIFRRRIDMRKVIVHMNVTLDGFTAGPNGELDWLVLDPDMWRDAVDRFHMIDTVLLGRVNYLGFYSFWPTVPSQPTSTPTDIEYSRWLDATSKVVFSRTLAKVEWQNARLANGGVAEEIAQLKQQPGKDMVVMTSTGLSQSLIQLGLVDEYWL